MWVEPEELIHPDANNEPKKLLRVKTYRWRTSSGWGRLIGQCDQATSGKENRLKMTRSQERLLYIPMLDESKGSSIPTLAVSMKLELSFPKYGSIICAFISNVDAGNGGRRSTGKRTVDVDPEHGFNGKA